MSRVSFEDTPESDSVAEHVMLEDIVKLEGRISQLEGNINMFIRYVASIRFTTAERDSAPWMSNWEANLLSGTLVAPIPYVEPEPEYEVEVIIVDDAEFARIGGAEIVDVDLAELPPADAAEVAADVADEDALVDETAVDDSEPPLSAA
ncbi:hypothetical protein LCGC14_0986800 [marine sediment metagenome]|uniref:Uncharacterized protein n=1 Tax=marine sediment metagenome TaxID=412755 RepID=A0A0F9NTJ2_9ZZZZ